MSFLARRLDSVKPSPTMAATARAKQLQAEGRDIIALQAGEPDFDTPVNIQEAAIAAMRAGDTRYTVVDGTPELKRAIQKQIETRLGRMIIKGEVHDNENVLVDLKPKAEELSFEVVPNPVTVTAA